MVTITKDTIFEVVIGIEVHAQLKTKTKLFGASSTQFGDKPNSNVDPVCLGLPGALPVLNKESTKMAVLAGLALNCEIRQTSVFSRKNYFYPDLPKGYQISQFDKPICEHGHLDIQVEGVEKRIGITRIHMEEDAGKLNHQGADSIEGATHSLVDLNRAGTPLIEIVSEPDIRSSAEAKAYVEALKTIVQHIGVCDGNMEEGSLRADANVSIRPVGQKEFGTRTEIKNLNSFRSLERAINVEVKRQKEVILAGGKIVQETRNYDDNSQTTTSLRGKEEAHDYRYFPEPDLPPLIISDEQLAEYKALLPELPEQKKSRYINDYQLSKHDVKVFIQDISTDLFFNHVLAEVKKATAKDVAKWVVGDLSAALKDSQSNFEATTLQPQRFAELMDLIAAGTISGKMGKQVLDELLKSDKTAQAIVDGLGGGQISDESALEDVVINILKSNMDVVEKIKAGKTQSANFLMGQVMKETKGRAKPDTVRELILKLVTTI
ncbi:MAG: Asp-tRNA(Asn)/Glu-tRNA(Gln) amidotransferase GatCAB subunit B [Rickettsiales bacterium]|nr:Asp-tRNA(Asn)/Glu-tRNA(Gln) amidotransferase GatCAB subunit B [Rickettsiales bacterium]